MPKAILITGCSSGIGLATAELFLNKGNVVYATARNPKTLDHLKEKGALVHPLDVTRKETIEAVISAIETDGHQLSGLVNNAGYGQLGPVEVVTEEQALNQLNTNVIGLASVTRHALPLMRKHHEGFVINVSSIAGRMAMPFSGWYSASKFAVEALTDALRLEVGQFGIRVIAIEPGPIRTSFGNVAYHSADHVPDDSIYKPMIERLSKWSKNTLSDRIAGQPIDAARIIYRVSQKKRPRARYRVTLIAKFLNVLKKNTNDRVLDYILRKQMGIKRTF